MNAFPRKKVIVSIALICCATVFGFVIIPQIYDLLYSANNPNFKIRQSDDTFDSTTGEYVFYAQIQNTGIDGYGEMTCTIKLENLTWTGKTQTIHLDHDEQTTVYFRWQMMYELNRQFVEDYHFRIDTWLPETSDNS